MDGAVSSELTLMDRHICSLLEIPISSTLHSINLHCNQITKLEGLGHVWNLQHLDLSSNCITRIDGLVSLTQLQTLNLSCNMIARVEGLEKLTSLKKLDLSYNRINDLTGFMSLHGNSHRVGHVYLHSNCINNLNHLLQCMVGLYNLLNLTLEKDGKGNPVCQVPGYREIVLQAMPHLNFLDGKNILGESENMTEGEFIDLPSLDFLQYLAPLNFDPPEGKSTASLLAATPRINEVLSQYQQHEKASTLSTRKDTASSSEPDTAKSDDAENLHRETRIKKLEDQIAHLLQKPDSSRTVTLQKVMKAKRETDPTSESDCGSGKDNQNASKKTRIPNYRKATQLSKHCANQSTKGKVLESGQKPSLTKRVRPKCSQNNKELSSSTSSGKLNTEEEATSPRNVITAQKNQQGNTDTASQVAEESTYRALVQELDQEREKRWKAEQIVTKLTFHIKELQSQTKEEKDISSMAVYTTDRLKELLLKERNNKAKLQAVIQHLNTEIERLKSELKLSINKEQEQRKDLKNLEDSLSKMNTASLHQQATEMKRIQEAELKATAAHREADLLRVSVRQHKEKVQQLHELVTSREQAHRKELETRVPLNGPQFQAAVAKEIEKEAQRHNQHVDNLQEKINLLKQQYMELEDEFRVALTIEAKRFKEVKDGFENVTTELAEHKRALAQSKQREKQSATLIQELTTMVKEQKTRIAEVAKSKEQTAYDLKKRLRALEGIANEEKRKTLEVELLKQDKAKLISQLTAQESMIDGLRAERKIWGQELAQQGVSLAQDRGRLEAKIEVLTTEVETLKKLNERDNDALRIKTKVVEDQTETIRKLKEGLQDRDDQIRKLRDENIVSQKTSQEQIDERTAQMEDLKLKLERLNERKEELKQQLEERDTELEDFKKEYRMMNRKWQDKASLLTQLEAQVKQMKEHFDSKEKKLTEERNKILQSQKVAVEKLHSVDDAFRRQLESLQASHRAELLQLANENQKQIEAANEKVYKVEEEMRQLLRETANSKKTMEDKIKRLTNALSDIQQEL